jgi:hypothetical protein
VGAGDAAAQRVVSRRSCCAAAGPALRLTGAAAGWLQPHIVLLDGGMATELSPEDQHDWAVQVGAQGGSLGVQWCYWQISK